MLMPSSHGTLCLGEVLGIRRIFSAQGLLLLGEELREKILGPLFHKVSAVAGIEGEIDICDAIICKDVECGLKLIYHYFSPERSQTKGLLSQTHSVWVSFPAPSPSWPKKYEDEEVLFLDHILSRLKGLRIPDLEVAGSVIRTIWASSSENILVASKAAFIS